MDFCWLKGRFNYQVQYFIKNIKPMYTPSSMKSKIREHLKKIGDNSEQNRRIES